jgi:four helix bundle protein
MDALKDLEVWRRACRFSADVYCLLADCRDSGFRDQLGRSALSMASNIAEGYERTSVKERAHYLKIAKGSSGEAWTQLLIGMEAGFLNRAEGLKKADEARQISKMLYRLIEYIEGSRL